MKLNLLLTIAITALASLMVAQPVNGTTTFYTTSTTVIHSNLPCGAGKSATLSGWLFSVQSTSNCGMNWTNSTGGDGRFQYLVGFGTFSQASFGSDDGSDFALKSLLWGVSTSSWTSKAMVFVGYKNGMPVPGATLVAVTPAGTGILNTQVVTFTNNIAFNDVDNITLAPAAGYTCNSILFFEEITVGTAGVICPTPTVTISNQTNVNCFGLSTGGATVAATGGTLFGYSWAPSGGSAASATGLTAGIYTVTVTNNCAASATQTISITQPAALATSTAVTNPLCNGGNGSATVTASGGTGAYSYTWSSGPTTSVEPTLLAGTYTVRVTDANNCNTTRSVTITQPSAIATSTGYTNAFCNGGSNGSASIAVSGGTSPYTYTWSTGATGSVITSLSAGSYTVRVIDANNCFSATRTINISQPSALATSTAITNALCNGTNGSATITASGGVGAYSYTWSSGPTTSVEPTLLAGTYTVRVTDANNCSITRSVTITQPSAVSTATGYTNVFCNGGSNGSASIAVSGGASPYTYTWSTGATGSVITSLSAGSYTVRAIDANNCSSATRTINISQPPALVTTTAITNVACNSGNGSATITASGGVGGYTYLWSNGVTTSSISGVAAGVYSATVTDANNCTSTKAVTIFQPSALVTTTAITNSACNGGNGSATITPSGGAGTYTYSWSNGATGASAILAAGTYTVRVTDANNCSSTSSVTITQPSALATTTAVTNAACNGSTGSATITASGGTGAYTYSWSTGATASVITSPAGAYTAYVTDANNCTSSRNVIISQASALVTTTAVTNVACNGGNGSATISASGGAGAYTYSWSNGAATSAVANLPAGVYTATVTDANNCTSSKNLSISQPAVLLANTTIRNALCNGGNGSATITASGGAGAYTYSWSNGAGTPVVSLPAGAYTATVTDANNCSTMRTLTITQPSAFTATASASAILCNGGISTITVSANGGTLPYTGAGTFTASAGTSSFMVTDNNGCSASAAITLSQPLALAISTAVTHALCHGGTGSATITASGGTGAYSYSWSNGSTASSISGISAGSYTATVTDANNCTASNVITMTQPTALSANAQISAILCHGSVSSITVTASGGTPAYTGTGVFNPPAGSYTYTVTDNNGCSATTSVQVSTPSSLSISVTSSPVLCNGSVAGVTVSANGGTPAYSGTGTFTAAAGSHTYTVNDLNGCTVTTVITISQPAILQASLSSSPVLCHGGRLTYTYRAYS